MIRLVKGTRGQVALLAAVLLAVLSLLGASVFTLSSGQKRAGVFYTDRVQAYYTAEDGVEEVLARIYQDWEELETIPRAPDYQLLYDRASPEGSLQVNGYQRPIPGAVVLYLKTKGVYRNATRHVLFEAVLYPPLDFTAGVTAGWWETEDPSLNEYLTGHLVVRPGPDIHPDWFRQRAQSVIGGNADLHGGAVDGLYYVDGDLTVHGGLYEGQAVFLAAGNIEIIGDYRPRNAGDGCVVLVTPNNVRLAEGCHAQVLMAAGGEVRLEHSARLAGGLMADRLYAGPESSIEPDVALAGLSLPVFCRGMDVVYWGDMLNVF